jgi:hypothetical protein
MNLLIGMLIFLIILLVIAYFRYDYLSNLLHNMCSYVYPKNYTCSCQSTKQIISLDLLNFSNITILR